MIIKEDEHITLPLWAGFSERQMKVHSHGLYNANEGGFSGNLSGDVVRFIYKPFYSNNIKHIQFRVEVVQSNCFPIVSGILKKKL